MATDCHIARTGRDEARDHAHGGTLAGAIGSQEPQHLAFLDREGHVVDRDLWAEGLFQVSDLDHVGRGSSPDAGIAWGAAEKQLFSPD